MLPQEAVIWHTTAVRQEKNAPTAISAARQGKPAKELPMPPQPAVPPANPALTPAQARMGKIKYAVLHQILRLAQAAAQEGQ